MLREVIYSLIGHGLVFGGLIFPSYLDGKPTTLTTVYTVKTVSPKAIEQLLSKSAPEGKPKPKIPQQVKIQPEQPLPKDHWRPRQTAKQSDSTSEKDSSSDKNGKQSNKSPVQGIKVDQEFDYPDYLIELSDTIKRNWRPPSLRVALKTRVFFRVSRDGKITRTYVEIKTGNMAFDQAAMNAVIRSTPFSPLPEDFPGKDIGIHMDFIYE